MKARTDTADAEYTERLETLESAWWKRLLDVQRPYRRHLQSLEMGFALDVGCGVGRNLRNLRGNAVGVDHNSASVALAQSRGYSAFLPDAFLASEYAKPGRFDSLLLAHVAEHMHFDEARVLLSTYLPFVKAGARVVLITPQRAGFRSESTHVELLDFAKLSSLATGLDLKVEDQYSFPFPQFVGSFFKYNEFVLLARKQK